MSADPKTARLAALRTGSGSLTGLSFASETAAASVYVLANGSPSVPYYGGGTSTAMARTLNRASFKLVLGSRSGRALRRLLRRRRHRCRRRRACCFRTEAQFNQRRRIDLARRRQV